MFKMQFDFTNRAEEDLSVINRALSGLPLSLVRVEDHKGYNAVSVTFDHAADTQETTARYGIDHMVLSCEANPDEDGDLFTWQVDTASLPKGRVMNSSVFHDLWCTEHPDRVMRTLIQIDFKDYNAFLILHHEKQD